MLLIMTDQHRADHTGFGGNRIVQTPTLDALAARSMVFDRAFVVNPLCQPNRCSVLTMRYPSVHGTRHNGIALDWRANTFVRRLRAEGYRTGLVGKGHFQNFGFYPEIARQQFDFSLDEQAIDHGMPHGWDHYEHVARHLEEDVEFPSDYYGFEHVEVVSNHGDSCTGHYVGWLRSKGHRWHDVAGPDNAERTFDGWDQVRKPSMPVELYPTTYVTERSAAWIADRAPHPEPWFLQCSYPDPHHPFTPPGRYADMFSPADVELPATFWDSHTRSPEHLRRITSQRGRLNPTPMLQSPDESQFRHAAAAEYGAIALIDDGISTVLGELERTGQADDTVVVFTSDHGDMFGDHGLILKMYAHYSGCIRVPLTVAAPSVVPGRTQATVNSVDLGETILELCGVDSFYGSQGRSMAPALRDPAAGLRETLLIEEDQIRDGLRAGVQPRMRTVVTADARLTRYQNLDYGELYDLSADPDELENRWADPAAAGLRQDMSDTLAEMMIACADPSFRPSYIA